VGSLRLAVLDALALAPPVPRLLQELRAHCPGLHLKLVGMPTLAQYEAGRVPLLSALEALQGWIADQGLDKDGFGALMEREARIRMVQDGAAPDFGVQLLDHLRLTGRYGALAARALAKRDCLARRRQDNPGCMDVPLSESELFEWFFSGARQGPLPTDPDLKARKMGFPDRFALLQAIVREYLFRSFQ